MKQTKCTGYSPDVTQRLTVEVGLWILIAIAGVALRVTDLGAAPLNVREARQAMLSWRAVTGQGGHGMAQGDYSPLLFAANALVFALCSSSDALARAWPALVGAALVLTPLLVRQRLGCLGSLAAGLYLAVSPSAIAASRQLDGTVVAAVGAMGLLGGLVRFWGDGRRFWLALAVGCLAAAITSGPSAYSTLLPLGLAAAGTLWASDGTLRELLEPVRPHWRWLLGMLLCTTAAFATGLGWHLGGLGATGDALMTWFARFSPVPSAAAPPLAVIAVYEPVALLFGLGGLVWAALRGQRLETMLGLWAGLGTVVLSIMPGRMPFEVVGIVVALALLTGSAVEAIGERLGTPGALRGTWLYTPVVLVLWVYFYLIFARYAAAGSPADLLLAALVVALQLLLAALFALGMRIDAAVCAFAAGTGAALLMATVSAGWRVAYVRPADPRELLIHQPTAVGVRDLEQTLRDLSWRETGMPTTLPFTYEAGPDSLLAWYLRDFAAARRVDRLDVGEIRQEHPVLITMQAELHLPDVPYIGQDFVLRREWKPSEIGCVWEWPPHCKTASEWLLFRRTAAPPQAERLAVLWLPEDVAEE